MSEIKLVNKKTGEVVTFGGKTSASVSQKKNESYVGSYERKTKETESEIAKRGNLYGGIAEKFGSKSAGRKVMGSLELAGAPMQQIESAIANPLLSIQAGNYNPSELAKQSWSGLQGIRQGELGDLFYRGGMGKTAASAAGLGLSIYAPLKAGKVMGKFFNGVSRMSDKKLLKASEKLIGSTDEALEFVGKKVGELYKPYEGITVDRNKLLQIVRKLPQPVVERIEETVGYMKDILANPTIGNMREIKRVLGKFRPSSFDKVAKGAKETLEDMRINEMYGGLKRIMEDTLKTNFGEKVSKTIMSAEHAYSSVSKASSTIRKAVTDSSTGWATTGGKAAEKLVKEGNSTFRQSLNVVRGTSKQARKAVDKAVSELESFNNWLALKKGVSMAGKAIVYGGGAGAIGGAAAGKVMGRNND